MGNQNNERPRSLSQLHVGESIMSVLPFEDVLPSNFDDGEEPEGAGRYNRRRRSMIVPWVHYMALPHHTLHSSAF